MAQRTIAVSELAREVTLEEVPHAEAGRQVVVTENGRDVWRWPASEEVADWEWGCTLTLPDSGRLLSGHVLPVHVNDVDDSGKDWGFVRLLDIQNLQERPCNLAPDEWDPDNTIVALDVDDSGRFTASLMAVDDGHSIVVVDHESGAVHEYLAPEECDLMAVPDLKWTAAPHHLALVGDDGEQPIKLDPATSQAVLEDT